MELNKDCVRDILLCVEKNLIMEDNGSMNSINSSYLEEKLPEYSLSVIKYTVLKLEESGIINALIIDPDSCLIKDFEIFDINFEGHEFLSKIKDDNNWNRVKEIAIKVGSMSVATLQQIAVGVLTNKINGML